MADDLTPCSDRGCILRTEKHRGQATNGGCEHLKMTEAHALRRLLRLVAADRQSTRRETIRECLAVVQGAESKVDAEDALAEMLEEGTGA